jgi:hypothetical protein
MRHGLRVSLIFGTLALGCADAAPLLVAGPPPRPRVSTRVFSGRAAMLFDGPACTREAGASGDRYCSFVTDGGDGARSLYVLNVSAVLRGTPVSCDAPDAHCILLTTIFGGDAFDPTQHGTLFQGDTLVYYDHFLTPYVWRPGMERGRVLVEPTAELDPTFCYPAPRGSGVACLVLPRSQSDPTLAHAELYSGKADGPREPLLEPLDAVIAANTRDQIPRFGYFFPADGEDRIAWTTRDGATGPEVLRLATVGTPSSIVTVASDVHDPVVSPDGRRWLWLSSIDTTGAGTLQVADFPFGGGVADVLGGAREFAVSPARGTVVARTSTADLVAVPLPNGVPGTPRTLDTKVQALVAVTDTEHVAYAKHFVGMTQIDLFVAKVDGSALCAVDTTATAHRQSLYFSTDSGSAVWARAKGGGAFDGQHTHVASCSTVPLAADVVALGWLGDDRVLLMDTFDPEAGSGTMRYRRITKNHRLRPEPAALIAENVDTYAISDPDRATLVYTVNGSGDADGVYVF